MKVSIDRTDVLTKQYDIIFQTIVIMCKCQRLCSTVGGCTKLIKAKPYQGRNKIKFVKLSILNKYVNKYYYIFT